MSEMEEVYYNECRGRMKVGGLKEEDELIISIKYDAVITQ